MDLNDKLTIRGVHKEVHRRIDTGEIVAVYEDDNIFLNQGKAEIFRAFSILDTNDHRVKTIKVGNDVGTGNALAPSAPTASFTEANQSVVYETPEEEFFVEYPTQTSVRYLATINGANVMALYPTVPNVIYSSAVLYSQAGKALAYRRFPSRTISSLISVDVSWTFTIS